jgi:hypothetical protein
MGDAGTQRHDDIGEPHPAGVMELRRKLPTGEVRFCAWRLRKDL